VTRALDVLTTVGLSAGLVLLPSAALAAPMGKSADLGITVSGPQSAGVGDVLSYAVRVANNGPAGASNVVATTDLHASMTLVSATTSQGSCSGTSRVTCSFAGVASGATVAAIIEVRTTAAGTFSVSAFVQATTHDSNAGNNSAEASTAVYTDRVATRTAPPAVTSRPCTMCGFFPYDVVTVTMSVVAMDGLPINEGWLSSGRCAAPVFNGFASCSYNGGAQLLTTQSAFYSGSATYAPSSSSL
jgi:uncharacterized repeat protein (TIGR01451 family)